MKHLGLALLLALLGFAPAQAQNVVGPSPVGAAGAYNTSPPTCTASGFCYIQTDANGNLKVVSSGTPSGTQNVAVLSQVPALGITPTDRTITSATGSSQTVMAANAARHSMTLVNTGSSNCGINPTGGTAVIGGAGTLTLLPNGAYTPRIPTLSAVTAICTAAQPLYADEN